MRVIVDGGRNYTITCDSEHPVSWLLSEVIRRHMEDTGAADANVDSGIRGIERATASAGAPPLDLAANIGSCMADGETLRARTHWAAKYMTDG